MKKVLLRILLSVSCLLSIALLALFWVVRAPTFVKASPIEMISPPLSERLNQHVLELTSFELNRSVHHPDVLNKAAHYIEQSFIEMGYQTERQQIPVDGLETYNIIALYNPENLSLDSSLVIVGAHYDVAEVYNPGADDNASGVAGLLELARVFKENKSNIKYPIQFVAYSTEEPPFFGSQQMGSAVHAQQLFETGRDVRLMYSLEMIGYFSDQPFSQEFPVPLLYLFYPWKGNFIGLVGRLFDVEAIKEVKKSFLAIDGLSTYSINAPVELAGVDYSDQKNYWDRGWPAVMVTDTAFLRNKEYHQPGDTADRLDYSQMALIVRALFQSINDLK